MKRILSSINGGLSSNNTNSIQNKNKGDKIKEKIRLREEHDLKRHKKESDEFSLKLTSVKPSSAKIVIFF